MHDHARLRAAGSMSYKMMLWFVVTVLAIESLVMSNVWTLGVALCLAMIAMWLEKNRRA